MRLRLTAEPQERLALEIEDVLFRNGRGAGDVPAREHLADLASSGENPVTAGLGARLVYTNGDLSQQDGFAVPIGGHVKFSPPRFDRFSIFGQIYFAPKVLSIGDMEKYEEYTVKFAYNVVREADIYIAYGRFPQAIGLLLGVLEDEPERNDVRMKLLEVY